MDEQTPSTTNEQPAVVPTVAVPAAQPAPQQGDGVIDPPVDQDEQTLVLDMLENFDGPSAEDLLAEAGIQDQQQPQPAEPAAPAPNAPQQQGQPQQPAVAPSAPAGQPQETVIQQQVPGQAPQPVPGQPALQGQVPAGAPGQAAPQAAVQGQPAAQPQVNPIEALRASVEAQRENFINVAAQSYADSFTDEDVEEFSSNPKVALSKMGARLHFDIVQNTLGMVAARLPEMMTGLMQAQSAHKQAEDAFYGQNPDLRAHDDKIRPIAQMYRQLNPTMPQEQFMANLAGLARMQLGLVQAQPQAPVQNPAPQPVVSAQPQRVPAFRPAGSAVPAAAQRPAGAQPNGQGLNEWGMIDVILEADQAGRLDGRF
jgi:hypothetical protein